MTSNALEVAGLACLVVVAVLVGGAIGGFAAGGVALLFVGAAMDSGPADQALARGVRTVAALPLRAWARVRQAYRIRVALETLLSGRDGP
jgi:hypothetical protein